MNSALKPVRRRIRRIRAARGACAGILLALLFCVALRMVSLFVPIEGFVRLAMAGACACLLLAVLCAFAWPVSPTAAAMAADASGLKERAQTALAFAEDESPIASLQRSDALAHLRALDVKKAIPLRINRRVPIATLALCVVFAALMLLPNPQDAVLRERLQVRQSLQAQADAIEKEAAKMLAQEPLTPEEQRDLRRITADMAQSLRQAEDKRDALAALDAQQREMERLQAEIRQRIAAETASAFDSQPALKGLSSAIASNSADAVQDALSSLAQAMEQSQLDTQSLSDQLSQAAEAAPQGQTQQALQAAASAAASGNAAQATASLAQASMSAMEGSAAATTSGNIGALMSMARSGTAQAGSGGQGGGGQGPGGSGAGSGSTNKDAGYNPSASQASQQQPSGGISDRLAAYERIYDPTRLGGANEASHVQGEEHDDETQQMQLGAGSGTLEGSVPYPQVIGEYREAAAQAMQRASLPASLQGWVNAYFDALIPEI